MKAVLLNYSVEAIVVAYSEELIQAVWEKGEVVRGVDKDKWRKDQCGAWIYRSSYGKSGTPLSMGWEVDHITPKANNGTDALSNLRPLQWENNRAKSDGRLQCTVTADGNKNKYK